MKIDKENQVIEFDPINRIRFINDDPPDAIVEQFENGKWTPVDDSTATQVYIQVLHQLLAFGTGD